MLDGPQLNDIPQFVGVAEHETQGHLKPIFLALNLFSLHCLLKCIRMFP
jgi:hypothetical protein